MDGVFEGNDTQGIAKRGVLIQMFVMLRDSVIYNHSNLPLTFKNNNHETPISLRV
jgi:hypothetical protein